MDINKAIEHICSSNIMIIDDTLGFESPHIIVKKMFRKHAEKITTMPHRIILWNPGTIFRQNHKKFNYKYYSDVLVAPDLLYLAEKLNIKNKIHAFYPPPYGLEISDNILMHKINKDKIIILHAPSSQKQKMSESIKKIVNTIDNSRFNYVELHGVSNEDVIEMKKKSLIYIDQLCSCKVSKNCGGSFGVSSIEALACGNIVLTCLHNYPKEYLDKKYDALNIYDTGYSDIDFKNALENVLKMDNDTLLDIAKQNYTWYKNNMTRKKMCGLLLDELNLQ